MYAPSHSELFQRLHRAHEARVLRRQETHLGHQQHAGVEVAPAKAFDKGLAFIAPGVLQDVAANDFRPLVPQAGAVRQAQHHGDLASQPVAGGPAHQRRRGVHPRAGAQLPHAGVGLVVQAPGLLAHISRAAKSAAVAAHQQPVVVEGLGAPSTMLP
jgi:hypothetical protein